MEEKSEPDKESAEAPESGPEIQTPKVVHGVETRKPATEEQLQEVKREMNAYERSTLKWMRTTAAIGAVTGLFICLQWCEMRSGSIDTRNLAVAAGRQADIAQSRNAPWVGIEQASIIRAHPEYAWYPVFPYPTIYVNADFSVRNYGVAPAFREHESVDVAPVPEKGGPTSSLRQICRIDAYRTPGQVALKGDIGEMILPGAIKVSGYSGNMTQNPQMLRDLKQIWITICIIYEDPGGQWHYSGYRYITTSGTGHAVPMLFPEHAGWSYLPYSAASLISASAE